VRPEGLLDADRPGGEGLPSKQNQGVEGFLATGPTGAETAAASKAAALKGMEDMSKMFRETGSELYMGAGGREHD
jgi:phosphomethylpyrimidine synthase